MFCIHRKVNICVIKGEAQHQITQHCNECVKTVTVYGSDERVKATT